MARDSFEVPLIKYKYIIENIDIINIHRIFIMYVSQRRLEKRNKTRKFETITINTLQLIRIVCVNLDSLNSFLFQNKD